MEFRITCGLSIDLMKLNLISIRHVIFKIDTKINLRKVETVSVSYVKGFRDEKYRRFDDLQICKYCGF